MRDHSFQKRNYSIVYEGHYDGVTITSCHLDLMHSRGSFLSTHQIRSTRVPDSFCRHGRKYMEGEFKGTKLVSDPFNTYFLLHKEYEILSGAGCISYGVPTKMRDPHNDTGDCCSIYPILEIVSDCKYKD